MILVSFLFYFLGSAIFVKGHPRLSIIYDYLLLLLWFIIIPNIIYGDNRLK